MACGGWSASWTPPSRASLDFSEDAHSQNFHFQQNFENDDAANFVLRCTPPAIGGSQ
jgi:hypothetical protein